MNQAFSLPNAMSSLAIQQVPVRIAPSHELDVDFHSDLSRGHPPSTTSKDERKMLLPLLM